VWHLPEFMVPSWAESSGGSGSLDIKQMGTFVIFAMAVAVVCPLGQRAREVRMEEYKALSQIIYGGIYRGIGLVFALLLGVYFVYEIWTIILVLLLALLFAIVLSGPVNYLARRDLPKALRFWVCSDA
jgi:hypothetical protein